MKVNLKSRKHLKYSVGKFLDKISLKKQKNYLINIYPTVDIAIIKNTKHFTRRKLKVLKELVTKNSKNHVLSYLKNFDLIKENRNLDQALKFPLKSRVQKSSILKNYDIKSIISLINNYLVQKKDYKNFSKDSKHNFIKLCFGLGAFK